MNQQPQPQSSAPPLTHFNAAYTSQYYTLALTKKEIKKESEMKINQSKYYVQSNDEEWLMKHASKAFEQTKIKQENMYGIFNDGDAVDEDEIEITSMSEIINEEEKEVITSKKRIKFKKFTKESQKKLKESLKIKKEKESRKKNK